MLDGNWYYVYVNSCVVNLVFFIESNGIGLEGCMLVFRCKDFMFGVLVVI